MNKTGRNDPCPCGSGKKYKQCCMQKTTGMANRQPAQASNAQISAALDSAARHVDAGSLNEAVAICKRVLQHAPNNAQALNLLGILAYQAGNDTLAVDLLGRAVLALPNYADAHNNLGAVLRDLGRSQEAITCFQKALAVNPRYLDALINCGNALQDVGQRTDAVAQYRRALQIAPKHGGALSNLGNALQELGNHQEAAATFQQLLAIDPDYDYAFGSLVYSRLHCCDWATWDADVRGVLQAIEAGKRVCKPFDLLAIADSPLRQLACARTFIQHKFPPPLQPTPGLQYSHDKIRVAYLSADFRQHAVSQLLVQLIEQHDRKRFEVIGISYGTDDKSALRDRITRAFDQFIDVRNQSDRQVAARLREMQVDIAIDLMGFTTNSRLGILAERAAPVQASFLGYAGTTGADYIDYILADPVIIPADMQHSYAEHPARLPDCFQPNDTERPVAPNTPTRAEAGLPEQGFVFCAFNSHYKITPPIFDIWMRLLRRIDGSVLWLARCNDVVKNNLRRQAEIRGVSSERLVFAERTRDLADHLARHRLADLFLDTLPYNAHTTASDALWAGLPVLTCAGQGYAARVAASLLQAAGLPELVTHTLEEYEALAEELATHSARLVELRGRLAEHRASCPLFDTQRYRHHYEAALHAMWQRARNGEPAACFATARIS